MGGAERLPLRIVRLSAAWLVFAVQADRAFGTEVEVHGFAQANYASRVTGGDVRPEAGDFLIGEERVQLALSGSEVAAGGGFLAKTDIFHDAVAGGASVEVREAYVDMGSDRAALRVGRQIVTWGTGDLLFVNDVFPKDWAALLSGRPLEYLKVGSDALKTDLFLGRFSIEGIVVPFFEADRLPGPDRFFFFDPFPQVGARGMTPPKKEIGNAELALRLSHPVANWDAAAYAYRGFFRTPTLVPDDPASPTRLDMRFPRLAVYGLSARGPAAGGVVNLEGGFYDSREDHAGSDPLVSNSRAIHLLGYQRQLMADFMAGVQYYGEVMMKHDRYASALPQDFPEQDAWRQLVTLRLTGLMRYQTLRLSLFGYWSPTDEDFYLIPEARYAMADGLWATAGGNIFGGKERTTFFGQFDRNDNVYLNLRYEF
ncbi:MAG: hypothetical protein HYY13_05690 [Nitrospirae bacterium]|nr:hypothetical protein [Nitrospirota bacterium]